LRPRSDGDPRRRLGARGEREAARYLRRRKRYRILARNYQCPAGEIDIIASDGPTLVFVEVKTRSTREHEEPLPRISPFQRGQIEGAAKYFLMRNTAQDRPSRFDVVTVCFPCNGKPWIEHFEDAFGPTVG